MTSTSKFGHLVRFDPANLGAQDPVSTGHVMLALNNVDHLADVIGGVPVGFPAMNGKFLAPQTVSTTTFQRVWTSGPMILRVRDDGSPYAFRCWLAAKASQANTVTFRIAIGLREEIEFLVITGNTTQVLEGATAAIVMTELSTIIPGGAARKYIDLPTDARALRTLSTPSDVLATEDWSVNSMEMVAEVWAKTSNIGAIPQLGGVMVAQYHR